MLIRNVTPELYGGGETYQLMLAYELKANGFEPMIVTSCEKLLKAAKSEGIAVVQAPYLRKQNWSSWRNIFFPVYAMWQLWLKHWYKKLFKMYQPTVINVQSRDDWIAATKAAKKLGIRVLWTDHVDLRSWVLTNVQIWYKNWIGKWILKTLQKADRLIVISKYEKRWLDKQGIAQRYRNIVTIENGALDYRDEYNKIKVRSQSFVYLGRVVDYKGIGELIAAFRQVVVKIPEAELYIYGAGEDVKKYRGASKNMPQIKWMGETREPLRVLAENEIFVLPSHREGLSLSLLDAAMMGKKIIASKVGGNPEIVRDGETGLLAPTHDARALAKAMLWILENPKEAQKMAEAARAHYEKNFDFSKIFTEQMLPLYKTES